MANGNENRFERFEALRKESATIELGAYRYALSANWYESLRKGKPQLGPPKIASPKDKPDQLVWIPVACVDLLQEWYGQTPVSPLAEWRRGIVVFINEQGDEEIEEAATYTVVEVRIDEKSSQPLAKLENVSAGEEIPQLVRKALDSVSSLSTVDEEDVRLWIRKSGEAEFHLCSSDDAKVRGTSNPDENLPEDIEGSVDSAKSVPTLRTVLGSSKPGQTLHFLLELRDVDGKFTRGEAKMPSTVITPKNGNNGSRAGDTVSSRPKSFSAAIGPGIGQFCDVQRLKDDMWLEAKIIGVNGENVKVHYLSFPTEADEVLPANSPRLQAPHFRVPDWREQLKVGEEIDVHSFAFQLRRGGKLYKLMIEMTRQSWWVAGTVRKVERNLPEPRVNIAVRFRYGAESSFWVPLNSEKIAKRYTHLARPKAEAYGPQSAQGAPPLPGVVGLRNLGNTCYMNSMLQCLSHCDPLRDFFVSGKYMEELNYKNPLGTGGELARAFAEVLAEIWSDNYQVVAPRRFKQVLGQMNSQFQGYQQHDSQELLTLLADSLHEDLNRVRNKPTTGPVESGGRPDEVVAKESWDTFKKRNDSRVVDEMYGLMKSHLFCNVCTKEAVKFDAYSNISVPVPSSIAAKVKLIFVDQSLKATRCIMSVPKRAPASAWIEWLCTTFQIADADDLVVAETFHNKTAFFYHRAAIVGGVPATDGGATEGFERKNWKDASNANLVIAWQLPSKKQVSQAPTSPPNSLAEFDARWSAFVKEINMILAAGDSHGPSESVVQRCRELFASKYMSELGGPFAVAQKKLLKSVSSIKNVEIGHILAKEAIKLAEAAAFFSCAVEPELSREALKGASNGDDASSIGDADPSANSSSSSLAEGSSTGRGIQKKISSPFRIFRPFGNSSRDVLANNGSSSPQIPTRTATPPTSAVPPRTGTPPAASNGHSQPASLQAIAPTMPVPLSAPIATSERIPLEVRHHFSKCIRRRCQLVPVFFAVTPQHTCDALRAIVEEYISKIVLNGFVDSSEANSPVISSPAASAAQMELGTHQAARLGPKSASYSLQIDASNQVMLPIGPIPLSESLLLRVPVNALSITIIWRDCAAADFAYRSVEQDTDDPERTLDGDLGLGPVNIHSSCKQSEPANGPSKESTLEQCLDLFRQKEQLSEDDPWYCESCKVHRCAFKKMDLWNTPRILVIHLKRFLYERVGGALGERVQREKIVDLVKFPINGFDIGSMLVGKKQYNLSTVYDLFAVSNHMGGLGGGHYTAFVKSSKDGSWWLMNDGICTKVEKQDEEAQIVSSNAYVLFYRRRD